MEGPSPLENAARRTRRWMRADVGTPVARGWPAIVQAVDHHGLALTLVAAPTLVFPGRWTAVGLGLLALGWLARLASSGRLSARTPLDWPIGLLVVATVVGTLASSIPGVSASKLLGIVLGVCTYYALADSPPEMPFIRRVVDGLALLGAGVALLALVGTDWTYARIVHHPALDRVYAALPALVRGLPGSGLPGHGELINPREVGGTLALLLPLPLVMLIGERSGWHRALLAVCSLVMAGVLLLSQTPSALAGVGVALWLALVIADRARRSLWLGGGLAIGALALGLLYATALGLVGGAESSLRERARPGAEHSALGVAARLELWPRALQMLRDTPYTGIGLNTFPWVMDRFYPGYVLGPEPHAHNFLLQTGVDLGLPGLIGLLWLVLAFFGSQSRVYRQAGGDFERWLGLGLAVSVLSFLIFGLLDAVTLGAKPGLALWLVLGLGALLARAVRGDRQPGWTSRLDRSMLGLLAAALVLPLTWGGLNSNAGRLLAYRGLQPESPPYGDARLLAQGRTLLERAAAVDPASAGTWYVLGMVEGRLDEPERAVDALRAGARADSQAPFWRYSPGDALAPAAHGTDWSGLERVHRNWTIRYPDRAEWYVTRAVVFAEGMGNPEAAADVLAEGLRRGAEPRVILESAGSMVLNR